MSKKREGEVGLFKRFLELKPDFCGEDLKEWAPPDDEKDFPDIRGVTVSGRSVGVEIGEWFNEDEIQTTKRKEKTEAAYIEAVGNQGRNFTKHVQCVWLYPRRGKVAPRDVALFREQLFDFIDVCDKRWPVRCVYSIRSRRALVLVQESAAVSYTHLTLPTNREV